MKESQKNRLLKTDVVRPHSALLEEWLLANEHRVIIALCLIAAFRVLAFSAAFPFFSQVDEHSHFDLIYKYAYEQTPRKLENFSPGSSRLIGTLGSPEFLFVPSQFAGNSMPPPWWTQPDSLESQEFRKRRIDNLLAMQNHESNQPPAYYLVAAQWYRLGKLLGLNGSRELYWIRFLGVISFTLFVWMAAVCAKALFPSNPCLRFGVPILAAVFPQDVLFTLNNDVMSPVFVGLAFFLLIACYTSHFDSVRRSILTGLAISVAFLTKDSNVAILILTAVIGVITLWNPERKAAGEWRKALLVGGIAAVPIGFRITWNLMVLGDLSGSAEKVKSLGWTTKPFLSIWDHPIFTPSGFIYFWNGLFASFWRGEITWHRVPLTLTSFDFFYPLTSLVLLAAAAYSLRNSRLEMSPGGRFSLQAGLLITAATVAFLAILSIVYDFGECVYPSREHPFFTSGRLMLGMLLPFLILYVHGLDFILSKLQWSRYRMVIVLLIGLAITFSEIAISRPVFASAYNWYHIPSGI